MAIRVKSMSLGRLVVACLVAVPCFLVPLTETAAANASSGARAACRSLALAKGVLPFEKAIDALKQVPEKQLANLTMLVSYDPARYEVKIGHWCRNHFENDATIAAAAFAAPKEVGKPADEQNKLGTRVWYPSGASIQVFSYRQPVTADDPNLTPADGYEFGLADVEMCAGSQGPLPIRAIGFTAIVAGDDRDFNVPGGVVREPGLGLRDLQAGECARGWLPFEIPAGERPRLITWNFPDWGSAILYWKIP